MQYFFIHKQKYLFFPLILLFIYYYFLLSCYVKPHGGHDLHHVPRSLCAHAVNTTDHVTAPGSLRDLASVIERKVRRSGTGRLVGPFRVTWTPGHLDRGHLDTGGDTMSRECTRRLSTATGDKLRKFNSLRGELRIRLCPTVSCGAAVKLSPWFTSLRVSPPLFLPRVQVGRRGAVSSGTWWL